MFRSKRIKRKGFPLGLNSWHSPKEPHKSGYEMPMCHLIKHNWAIEPLPWRAKE